MIVVSRKDEACLLAARLPLPLMQMLVLVEMHVTDDAETGASAVMQQAH